MKVGCNENTIFISHMGGKHLQILKIDTRELWINLSCQVAWRLRHLSRISRYYWMSGQRSGMMDGCCGPSGVRSCKRAGSQHLPRSLLCSLAWTIGREFLLEFHLILAQWQVGSPSFGKRGHQKAICPPMSLLSVSVFLSLPALVSFSKASGLPRCLDRCSF